MPAETTSEDDPGDWILFAVERLRAADAVEEKLGATLSAVELLQEAAERYLKGYLIATGWRLVRTHDLRALLKEAVDADRRFEAFLDMADELTADFFAAHYPGGDIHEVGQNYPTLRAAVGEMAALISQLIPGSFPNQP